MTGDDMRPKERAWAVAGHQWEMASGLEFPELWAARGKPAMLFIPAVYDDDARELAFGWAMAELAEQRGGWLFLVRRLIYFANDLGRIASAFGMVMLAVYMV